MLTTHEAMDELQELLHQWRVFEVERERQKARIKERIQTLLDVVGLGPERVPDTINLGEEFVGEVKVVEEGASKTKETNRTTPPIVDNRITKVLSEHGAMTAAGISNVLGGAKVSGWLNQLKNKGYIKHNPETHKYSL